MDRVYGPDLMFLICDSLRRSGYSHFLYGGAPGVAEELKSRLDAGAEEWDDPTFAPVLADFRRRFSNTNTEEGAVMATVLAYVMDQTYASSRRTLLIQFRQSEHVQELIERGIRQLDVRLPDLHAVHSGGG